MIMNRNTRQGTKHQGAEHGTFVIWYFMNYSASITWHLARNNELGRQPNHEGALSLCKQNKKQEKPSTTMMEQKRQKTAHR